MFCHNQKALMTPAPMPGQAALPGESGCSPWKALPGPSSSAPSTSSSSQWAGAASYLSIIAGPGVTPQTGKTQESCTVSSFFSVNTSGRAVPPGGTAAAVPGLLRLGCWRSAWCTQSLQDTSHNFSHFLVGFRSVCVVSIWVLWSSPAVRFCSLSGVGSVSS